MFSLDTNVEAMQNINKAIPPIINGLNFMDKPVISVAAPPRSKNIGGGIIFSLMHRNIAINIAILITCHKVLINVSK
jgi:hypothetical protein